MAPKKKVTKPKAMIMAKHAAEQEQRERSKPTEGKTWEYVCDCNEDECDACARASELRVARQRMPRGVTLVNFIGWTTNLHNIGAQHDPVGLISSYMYSRYCTRTWIDPSHSCPKVQPRRNHGEFCAKKRQWARHIRAVADDT